MGTDKNTIAAGSAKKRADVWGQLGIPEARGARRTANSQRRACCDWGFGLDGGGEVAGGVRTLDGGKCKWSFLMY